MARLPMVERELWGRAERITKNQWMELYRDLYLQTHGEATGTEWLEDAQRRLSLLKSQGLSR